MGVSLSLCAFPYRIPSTSISCLLQYTLQGYRVLPSRNIKSGWDISLKASCEHKQHMLGHLRHRKKKSGPGGHNLGSSPCSALQ